MKQSNRDFFDQQVDWVLDRLPRKILRLLMEIPLHVEDQPSPELMQELQVSTPEDICGCFSGTPQQNKTNASNAWKEVGIWGIVGVPWPSSVTIFRRGIVAASRDERGKVSRNQLRQEIRTTILHELAHLHGMDEEEIAEMGYG